MGRLTAALAAFAFAQPVLAAPADPERAAVIATVQQFFDGMAANDPKLMGEVLMAEGVTASVRPGASGSTVVRFTPQKQFLERRGGDKSSRCGTRWSPAAATSPCSGRPTNSS